MCWHKNIGTEPLQWFVLTGLCFCFSLQHVHVHLPGWAGGPDALWDVPGPGGEDGMWSLCFTIDYLNWFTRLNMCNIYCTWNNTKCRWVRKFGFLQKKRIPVKIETGTGGIHDVDISWIPQETLNAMSTSILWQRTETVWILYTHLLFVCPVRSFVTWLYFSI